MLGFVVRAPAQDYHAIIQSMIQRDTGSTLRKTHHKYENNRITSNTQYEAIFNVTIDHNIFQKRASVSYRQETASKVGICVIYALKNSPKCSIDAQPLNSVHGNPDIHQDERQKGLVN
jgi:hypothetical protein